MQFMFYDNTEEKEPSVSVTSTIPHEPFQNEILDRIKRKYKHYIENPLCVYKLCQSEWLVIMEKLPSTKTNETRPNVKNHMYAKFRANKLKVLAIVNVNNEKNLAVLLHTFQFENINSTVLYEVEKEVTPDHFDKEIENVCSNGIHYFKMIDRAFLYRDSPIDYTGIWFDWYDSGQIKNRQIYVNGQRDGIYTSYQEEGDKRSEGKYENDKQVGIWLEWFTGGEKYSEEYFVNGKRHGKSIHWSYDGNILRVGFYKNGYMDGIWTYLNPNGIGKTLNKFVDGMFHSEVVDLE